MSIPKYMMSLGCDPEFFFSNKDGVVGSEKVIPELGLSMAYGASKVTRDGVQAEINPKPAACRAYIANHIAEAFRGIRKIAKEKNVEINISRSVKVGREELLSLSQKSRELGCAPSISLRDKEFDIAKIVKGRVTKTRSAGGHIHIGVTDYNMMDTHFPEIKQYSDKLVALLDLIVANTFVIWDKDPTNAIRRRLYGRAGEHRLPSHGGVEYRTLSNFWLHHEALFSLVFGMVRLAGSIVISDSRNNTKHGEELLDLVDPAKLVKAINKNNPELAHEIWEVVQKPLAEMLGIGDHVITKHSIKYFNHFLYKGPEYWWPSETHNVVEHWVGLPEGHNIGWGQFLNAVMLDFNKNK